MRVRLFWDIGHVMLKIDWEHMHIKPTKIKTCNITTYERVKSATAGPVTDTYF